MAIYWNVFVTEQAGEVVITPGAGKKIFALQERIETGDGEATVEFGGGEKISSVPPNSQFYSHGIHEGAVDETVKVTCPANTKVIIIYEEG